MEDKATQTVDPNNEQEVEVGGSNNLQGLLRLMGTPQVLHTIYEYSSGPLYLLGKNFHKDKRLLPSYDRADRNGNYHFNLAKGFGIPYCAGTYSSWTKKRPESHIIKESSDPGYNPHGGNFVLGSVLERGFLPSVIFSENRMHEVVLWIDREYYIPGRSGGLYYQTTDEQLPPIHRITSPDQPDSKIILLSFHPMNQRDHYVLERTVGLQGNPPIFRTDGSNQWSYYSFDSSKPIYSGKSKDSPGGLLLNGFPPLTRVQLQTPLQRIYPDFSFDMSLSLKNFPPGTPEIQTIKSFIRDNPELSREKRIGSMIGLRMNP